MAEAVETDPEADLEMALEGSANFVDLVDFVR